MAVRVSEKGEEQPSEAPPPTYNETIEHSEAATANTQATAPSQDIPIVTHASHTPHEALSSPQPVQPQPIYQDADQSRGLNTPQHQQPMHQQQPVYQQQPGYVQSPDGQQVSMQPLATNGQYAQPQIVPLTALGAYPAPVVCPRCGKMAPTRIERVIGNTTHAIAAAACFVVCLGCIPYLVDSLRDVEHKCSSCGSWLATWHRSGRTIVHAM